MPQRRRITTCRHCGALDQHYLRLRGSGIDLIALQSTHALLALRLRRSDSPRDRSAQFLKRRCGGGLCLQHAHCFGAGWRQHGAVCGRDRAIRVFRVALFFEELLAHEIRRQRFVTEVLDVDGVGRIIRQRCRLVRHAPPDECLEDCLPATSTQVGGSVWAAAAARRQPSASQTDARQRALTCYRNSRCRPRHRINRQDCPLIGAAMHRVPVRKKTGSRTPPRHHQTSSRRRPSRRKGYAGVWRRAYSSLSAGR